MSQHLGFQTETEGDALGMRVGLRTRTLADERLAFVKRIGVDDIFVDPFQQGDVFGDTEAEFDDDVTVTVDERDDIVFVHFRDVIGTWPSFRETFVDDEESNFDPLDAVHALQDVGFEGVLVPDHVPDVIGDTEWGHRARAHATAYMKGLVRCASHGE